jgi:hypothetical protein
LAVLFIGRTLKKVPSTYLEIAFSKITPLEITILGVGRLMKTAIFRAGPGRISRLAFGEHAGEPTSM